MMCDSLLPDVPELVDRLTAISYDEILFIKAYTILELFYSSVNMCSFVVALMLEGIALYAYGGVANNLMSLIDYSKLV